MANLGGAGEVSVFSDPPGMGAAAREVKACGCVERGGATEGSHRNNCTEIDHLEYRHP